jgi:hypothetical protein
MTAMISWGFGIEETGARLSEEPESKGWRAPGRLEPDHRSMAGSRPGSDH